MQCSAYINFPLNQHTFHASGVKGDTGGGVGDAENAGNSSSLNTISMYLLKMQDLPLNIITVGFSISLLIVVCFFMIIWQSIHINHFSLQHIFCFTCIFCFSITGLSAIVIIFINCISLHKKYNTT